MRRLLRWAFNVAAAVSALLFLAACVLWVRSYRASHGASLVWDRGSVLTGWSFTDGLGRLTFNRIEFRWPDPPGIPAVGPARLSCSSDSWPPSAQPPDTLIGRRPPPISTAWNRAGFFLIRNKSTNGVGVSAAVLQVTAPHWVVAIVTATPAAARVLFRRRGWRHRNKHGTCSKCDYDLRATPARCPECGTVPTRKGVTA